MARNKQKQIDEVCSFANVFCEKTDAYFEREAPLVLELACGHGQYTLEMAAKFPERNFIGVDKKGDRIWNGSVNASERGLKNAAFIRTMIENLGDFFDDGEIEEIWITFPDPFSKPCKHKKRLTSARHLDVYKRILKKGGVMHLKTDNLKFFEYSLETVKEYGCEIFEEVWDVHGGNEGPSLLREILTFYEKKFMDKGPIYYMRFGF